MKTELKKVVEYFIFYRISADSGFDQKTGQYIKGVSIDVLASNEKEALAKAKTLVKRENYVVTTVIEKEIL